MIDDPIRQRADVRIGLLEGGYTPLPAAGKRILIPGWSRAQVDADWLARYARSYRFSNTGIRCDGLVVFDIDIDDADTADACEARIAEHCGESELCRFSGRGGRRVVVYRIGEGVVLPQRTDKYRTSASSDDASGEGRVELLTGAGQQFIAFGTHPAGGVYAWDTLSPLDTSTESLQPVDDITARQAMQSLDALMLGRGWSPIEKGGSSAAGAAHGTVHDLAPDTPVQIDGVALRWGDIRDGLDEQGRWGNLIREHGAFGDSGGVHFYRMAGLGVVGAYDFANDVLHYEQPGRIDLPTRNEPDPAYRGDSESTADADRFQADGGGALPEFLRTYVLMGDRTVRRLDAPRSVQDIQGFSLLHAHLTVPAPTQKRPTATAPLVRTWIEHADTLRAEYAAFRPDQPEGLFTDGPDRVLNLYRAPRHLADGGSVEPVLDFVQHLIPGERERDVFLDWHALKIARPWLRMHGLVTVTPAFGTGRGTWAEIVRRLLGSRHVVQTDFSSVFGNGSQSQFNSYLNESLIVYVAEAVDSEDSASASSWRARMRAYDRVKSLCDTRSSEIEVRRKYGRNTIERVYSSVLISTNHPDALAIDPGDRRLLVLSNTRTPLLQAQGGLHRRLIDWMARPANIGAFYRWLVDRADGCTYDPDAMPMVTAAKRAMIDSGRSDLDALFGTYVRECAGEVCTAQQLRDYVNRHRLTGQFIVPDGRNLDTAIAGLLRAQAERPALSDQGTLKVGGQVLRPWVIRNFEFWCNAENTHEYRADLRREIAKNDGVSARRDA